MLLYEYFIEPDKINKISLRALKYFAQELSLFLSFYEKDILLVSQDEIDAFNRLKRLSQILNAGQYNLLVNNPELVIDFSDNSDNDYLPDYYPY
jgi:hypothetical protein